VSEAQDSEQAGEPGDPLEIPRLGFFQLVPKRNLAKIVMLLFVLAGIIFIQRRSSTLVRQISDVVMPQPARPEAASPRVRLAPPEAPRR
jgi:hypothetical protein